MTDVGAGLPLVDALNPVGLELTFQDFGQIDLGAFAQLLGCLVGECALQLFDFVQ